jgi:hypothetical protein
MSWLVYGIVFSRSREHASDHSPLELPPGVDKAAVRLIEERSLGAAVSWVESPEVTPNVARALSYGKVVEALHADRVVLPMRYGCLFGEESQVVELLRVHSEEYAVALRRLDGCVEMGVRILRPAESPVRCSLSGSEIEGASVLPAPRASRQTGRAYLTDRAARYAREEEADRALDAVMERLRRALGGLAERTGTDCGVRADGVPSSLYFLVKRGAVESFRLAFRGIERAEPARLLLSGPWPPYNFVGPQRHRNGRG